MSIKTRKTRLVVPILIVLIIAYIELPVSWHGALTRLVGWEKGLAILQSSKDLAVLGLVIAGFILGFLACKQFSTDQKQETSC